MTSSTTLTIRLPAEVKTQLAKLAGYTRRKQSFLGAEAVQAYVARELAIVEAIERGRVDIRAGRTVSHADVAHEASAVIEAARAGKA